MKNGHAWPVLNCCRISLVEKSEKTVHASKPFTVPGVQYAIELAVQQMAGLATQLVSEASVTLAGSPLDGLAGRLPAAKAHWSEDVLMRGAFSVKFRDRLLKINCVEVLVIEANKDYSLLRPVNAG